MVLKSDASSGGTGVRVVRQAEDAAKQWKRLRGPTSLARTINRVRNFLKAHQPATAAR